MKNSPRVFLAITILSLLILAPRPAKAVVAVSYTPPAVLTDPSTGTITGTTDPTADPGSSFAPDSLSLVGPAYTINATGTSEIKTQWSYVSSDSDKLTVATGGKYTITIIGSTHITLPNDMAADEVVTFKVWSFLNGLDTPIIWSTSMPSASGDLTWNLSKSISLAAGTYYLGEASSVDWTNPQSGQSISFGSVYNVNLTSVAPEPATLVGGLMASVLGLGCAWRCRTRRPR